MSEILNQKYDDQNNFEVDEEYERMDKDKSSDSSNDVNDLEQNNMINQDDFDDMDDDEDDASSSEEDYPQNPESSDLNELIDICIYKVFSKDATRSLPRKFYVEKLILYICKMYEYNEFLADKFYQLFNCNIKEAIIANESERPVNLRVNSLKNTKKELVDSLKSKSVEFHSSFKDARHSALSIKNSSVPIGATTEYLVGKYAIQGLASILTVNSMEIPRKIEDLNQFRILDMCAAPGGKTSHICELMQNSGILVANELNEDRAKSVFSNLHRLGCENVVLTIDDGRNLKDAMQGFDRVLIDAPCSGTGIINKDPSVRSSKNSHNISMLSELQKELLLSAIDCCKENGIIVYSTCSILTMENEAVIDYALQKRNVKLLETKISIGQEGLTNFRGQKFHPDLSKTRRFYPHIDNTDGFFICKIQKLSQKSLQSNITLNFVVSNKQKKLRKTLLKTRKKNKAANNSNSNSSKTNKRVSKHKDLIKKMREKDYEKAIRNAHKKNKLNTKDVNK